MEEGWGVNLPSRPASFSIRTAPHSKRLLGQHLPSQHSFKCPWLSSTHRLQPCLPLLPPQPNYAGERAVAAAQREEAQRVRYQRHEEGRRGEGRGRKRSRSRSEDSRAAGREEGVRGGGREGVPLRAERGSSRGEGRERERRRSRWVGWWGVFSRHHREAQAAAGGNRAGLAGPYSRRGWPWLSAGATLGLFELL